MNHRDFLRDAAAMAGYIMREHWTPKGVDFTLKADGTKVTLADTQIGAKLALMFRETYPEYVCIREEADFPKRTGEGWEGIFDELDGTGNFTAGGREAVFAGAFMQDGVVMNSIIHAPLLKTPSTFTAHKRIGAFRNGMSISVSPKTSGDLRVIVGTASPEPDLREQYYAARVTVDLQEAGYIVEPMKSSSYSCARLAEGDAHGVVFAWSAIHDMAMGQLLVEEAGGCSCTLDGTQLDFRQNTQPGYLMANRPEVLRELQEIVSRHRHEPGTPFV